MTGNSGAPLEHLASVTVCNTLGFGAKRLRVLEPAFFANGAEVGGVRERAPGSPTHPLAHRGAWRHRAGRGSSAPPLMQVKVKQSTKNKNKGRPGAGALYSKGSGRTAGAGVPLFTFCFLLRRRASAVHGVRCAVRCAAASSNDLFYLNPALPEEAGCMMCSVLRHAFAMSNMPALWPPTAARASSNRSKIASSIQCATTTACCAQTTRQLLALIR
jgi:hypothetical protein